MRPYWKCRRAKEFAGDFIIGLVLFLAVLAIAALETRAAPATTAFTGHAPQTARPPALHPSTVTMGTLLLRTPGGEQDGGFVAATRLDTSVDISVTGPLARATVTQRFRNTGSDWVEGVYAFPLPEDAAADAMSMKIGGRTVEGRIAPRAQAREIYEAAREAGRGAGLLSQHGPNVFTSSAANIGPGEEITVRIEYQETLGRNGETYSLRFPLIVAPRYAPATRVQPVKLGGRTASGGIPAPPVPGPELGKINPVSLQVRIDAGFPLGEVRSDTHDIAFKRTGGETALVALTQGHVPADRDFELTWKAEESAAPRATAFREAGSGHGYLLAMLAPPDPGSAPAPPPRDTVFVIDTSGSMAGASIRQAKESLALALKRLDPTDRFNVVRFDDETRKLFDASVPATAENLAIARHFVSRLEGRGGTRMLPALEAALADPPEARKRKKRLRQVVFLTDGAISNESELLSLLATRRGGARLFFVGIGSAPNSFLMRRAAEIGRGGFEHIPAQSQVKARMDRLFRRLEWPVITDLRLEWPSGVRAEAAPDPLPDLYSGEPIAISARVSSLKGELTIKGNIAGEPWSQTLKLAGAKKAQGVGKFWARRKIAALEARRYAGQPVKDVNAAIETVALEHGLVSRMTSLVAVDVTPARAGDQPLASEDLPINLPAGWIHDRVFEAEPGQRHAAHNAPARLAAKSSPRRPRTDAGPAQAPAAGKSSWPGGAAGELGETETRTALNAHTSGSAGAAPGAAQQGQPDRIGLLTVMAVFFSAMTALTLGLWRHLRHAVTPPRRKRRPLS